MKVKKTGIKIIVLSVITLLSISCYAQKTISEGTLVYNISTQSDKSSKTDPLNGATNSVFLKGGLSRTDMASPLGKETTIYDAKTGTGVILKEYSGQKLMITLTSANWITQNNKFEGINFINSSETKTIGSYNCTKATAKLRDGSTISVYYAPDITINNKEYNPIFKNLSGLPVQYEFESSKLKFQYLLVSASFASVPVGTFDVPKSGYRVLSFDDSRNGKKGGN